MAVVPEPCQDPSVYLKFLMAGGAERNVCFLTSGAQPRRLWIGKNNTLTLVTLISKAKGAFF